MAPLPVLIPTQQRTPIRAVSPDPPYTPPVNFFAYQEGGKVEPWHAPVGCIDWVKNQWQAWYKEIPFAVQSDNRTGGRRIHVHEYPGREFWDNEDLGRLRQQVDVQGFVYGDKSDEWSERLFAACTSPGAATLFLPMRVPLEARCMQVETSFRADAMGRIEFTMRFSLETYQASGGLGLASQYRRASPVFLQHEVSKAAEQVETQSRALFEQRFTGEHPGVARTQAATMMKTVGRRLRTAGASTRLPPVENATVAFEAGQIDRHATALSSLQSTSTNRRSTTASVTSQRSSGIATATAFTAAAVRGTGTTQQVMPQTGGPDEGFGGSLTRATRALRAAPEPGDIGQALLGLSTLSSASLATAAQSALGASSVRTELVLSEVVAAFTRRLALSEMCRSGVLVAPEKLPSAVILRQRFVQQLDQEIEALVAAPEAQAAMQKLRSALTEFTATWSQGGAATERVSALQTGRPLAIVASDFYVTRKQVQDRDRQLMKLNGVRHPLFPNTDLYAIKAP